MPIRTQHAPSNLITVTLPAKALRTLRAALALSAFAALDCASAANQTAAHISRSATPETIQEAAHDSMKLSSSKNERLMLDLLVTAAVALAFGRRFRISLRQARVNAMAT